MENDRTGLGIRAAVLLTIVSAATPVCNRKVDERAFVETYAALARATTRYADSTARKTAVHDSILAAHGFTRETFTACGGMYRDEPERWQGVWKKIEKLLDEPEPARRKAAPPGGRPAPPPDRKIIPKAR